MQQEREQEASRAELELDWNTNGGTLKNKFN